MGLVLNRVTSPPLLNIQRVMSKPCLIGADVSIQEFLSRGFYLAAEYAKPDGAFFLPSCWG